MNRETKSASEKRLRIQSRNFPTFAKKPFECDFEFFVFFFGRTTTTSSILGVRAEVEPLTALAEKYWQQQQQPSRVGK